VIKRRRMSEEEKVEARGSDSWGEDIRGEFVGRGGFVGRVGRGGFVGQGNGTSILSIPNELYRAAIVQRAKKLCGEGKEPNAKCFAEATKSVDADLKKGGVKVTNPGAAPGRVTR